MNRRATLAILAIVSTLLTPSTSSAAIKTGSSCKKVGLKAIDSGREFTCIKQGKKFVWNKGVKVKVEPVKVPASTPTPTPTPTPEKPRDQVNIKGAMIYGINSGMLTRKADSGSYFSTDSRASIGIDPIRVKAYEALNRDPRSREHSKINFIYRISPTFPEFLIEYTKRELDEAASLWNPVFDKKIDVYVDLVTEKDRESIKSNNWLSINLPNTFSRFDSKRERPFISGGGGYWNSDGVWSGKIYLATASHLDLDYINYEWPQVAKHEFFHVVQDYSFLKTERVRPRSESEFEKFFPMHFREGGANTISYLTAFRNLGWSSDALDWQVWKQADFTRTWKTIGSVADAKSLIVATETRYPEEAFEQSYAVGALMYEWVIGSYGLETFVKLLGSLSTTNSFADSVKLVLGMDKEAFYDKVSVYVYENSIRVKK